MALAALCISTLLALSLGECAVRLLAPQDITGSFRVQSPERGQLINRASGQAVHELGGRHVEYRFNKHHLRGDPPRGAKHRVLLLGDSFTFGVLLQQADTYPAKLDALAAERFGADTVEVLNGGVPGFGLANYVAWLEEFGPDVEPDMVVVFFNGGDIHRSVVSKLYTLRDDGTLTANSLPRRRLKALMNAVPGYRFLLEHSHLLQLLRRAFVPAMPSRQDTGPPPAPQPDPAVDLGEALFARLDAWCDARDVRLVVLTTGYQDSAHFGARRYPSLRFLERAPQLFEALEVPFFDIAPPLLAQVDSLEAVSIPIDQHPNERGADVIATHAWTVLQPQIDALLTPR